MTKVLSGIASRAAAKIVIIEANTIALGQQSLLLKTSSFWRALSEWNVTSKYYRNSQPLWQMCGGDAVAARMTLLEY